MHDIFRIFKLIQYLSAHLSIHTRRKLKSTYSDPMNSAFSKANANSLVNSERNAKSPPFKWVNLRKNKAFLEEKEGQRTLNRGILRRQRSQEMKPKDPDKVESEDGIMEPKMVSEDS
ncbi:hypothetical protein AB6A40_004093 [Gnathostoma spinigerum]|uniref:Uncharacterized protein n=1 Tax=Gnathostoma spinigerum TaxID=75299 RepID=A0ABD6EBF5_9BILA